MASYKASALLLMILLTLMADQSLASTEDGFLKPTDAGFLNPTDAGFLKPTDASEDGFLGCIGAFAHFGRCIQSLIRFITRKDSNPLPECCDAVMSTEVECIANFLITGGLDGAFAQEIYKFCALSAPPPEASGPAAPNLPPSRP
ncbi:hypothetical protein AMTR_s00067p00154960 [Amborella trichopoda]|uniref:Prolamin-like domain-containing protein n=1 Tax=Amborella trichopoda TaxID=13333 RepID=U5CZU6_AMBTC|nr:hypothetical protein AMTR_s00067p00154960 [Amborella trichopoda]